MRMAFFRRVLLIGIPLLLLVAFPQEGRARGLSNLSIDGTWVSARLKRALEQGERQEVDCYLTLRRSPLQVIGTCGKEVVEWPIPALLPSGGAAIEIRSEHRHLVIRAGTPNELELREGMGMRRLYRLSPKLLPTLEAWNWIQGRLVGRWRSEDGAILELRPDGTYAFEQESGVYRVRGELSSEGGAWGLLTLGEDDRQRRYLLHGEGDRLGLAELPRDLDVELPPVAGAGAGAQAEEAQQAEEEGGEEALPSDREEGEAEGTGGAGPGQGETAGALPPWVARQAVLPKREAAPEERAADAEPARIRFPRGEEPAPELWFSRETERVVEEEEEAPPVAVEPPPPSEPILPKARFCGCSAGEGAGGLALAFGLLALRRRSRAREDLRCCTRSKSNSGRCRISSIWSAPRMPPRWR